jgi:hypothetical protein
MKPMRGMIIFRGGMLHEARSTAMMIVLHRPVAVSETICPSRNWPAQEEKETKKRDEEAMHRFLFRCVVSLIEDETRFKAFEKPSVFLPPASPRLWSKNPFACAQGPGTSGRAILEFLQPP